ncbi:MAG: hypothetical protein A2161_07460 [Candidatus Schekmanbacteria bacterium RBG_13_48_7]|uniref:Uncharacterized protein n=1 Tax=Candidatus Schekmanbacteria bacterium RBG_13_48_7 TaxID=1817878 RepID=A0A1F7RMV8_9BACT|nr:MAG: hypothetical protein A2161_07460 [Candidatus Schekmanbacteria bacterium RBG_13_48_7]
MKMQKYLVVGIVFCFIYLYPSSCLAILTMLTEEAATLQQGNMEIEFGGSYFQLKDIPRGKIETNSSVGSTVFSEKIKKDHIRAPLVGIRYGISRYAEFYINWPAYIHQKDEIAGTQSDVGDVQVFTKLRLLREGKTTPAASFQIGTKLPNTSNESGLGTNETDFFSSVLFSKWVGKFTFHFNGGIAILSNPEMESRQKDRFIYGVGVVYHTLRTNIFAEVNRGLGIAPFETPVVARAGLIYKIVSWSFDLGFSSKIKGIGEDWGIIAGATYTFRIFE